jgi:hypothetical protein
VESSPLFVSLVVSQVLMLAITLHAGLIGAGALAGLWRSLPETADNFPLRAFFTVAIGFALQVTLLFVIGLAGGLYPSILIGVGIATGMIAVGAFWRIQTPLERPWREIIIATAFYIAVAVNAVRVPGFFDDTLYHLPLARFYAETHGLGLDSWVRFPLFPQNIELLFTLAFVLAPGNFLLAQGLATIPAFVIALGLMGAARWLRGSLVLGVGAGVAFLGLHVVDNTIGYAYIDLGLAMFGFAAVLGAVVFAAKAPIGGYIGLGLLAGAAAGSKPHGLVLAALVFAALAAARARPAALIAFAGATALLGCGWYLRSFVISGDPISPAGGDWFGYFLWDKEDLAGQRLEQGVHGVSKTLYQLPSAFIKAGANLLVPALLAPLAARRERFAVFTLWSVFVIYALFWFYVTQVDRYLAPVLAIGILLSLTFFYDVGVFFLDRVFPRALAAAAWPTAVNAALAILLIGYGAYALQRAGGVLSTWNTTLAGRYGYAAFRKASSLAPQYGSRLMQVGFEGSTYFYDGTLIGDWFGPGRYRQTVVFVDPLRLIPAAEMRETMIHFGAKLLAVNLKFVRFDADDYSRHFDVILDDGKQALLALKTGS